METYIGIILAGIAALVCSIKMKRGVAWARPGAVVFSLITLGLASVSMYRVTNAPALAQEKRTAIQAASGSHIGQTVAARHSGERILLLLNPQMPGSHSGYTTMSNPFQEALENSLEKSDALLTIQHFPLPADLILEAKAQSETSPGDPEGVNVEESYYFLDIETWLKGDAFVDYLKSLKGDYDVVISTFGLPYDLTLESLPTPEESPLLVAINVSTSDAEALVKHDTVESLFVYKQQNEINQKSHKNKSNEELFNRVYRMITG